MMLKSFSKKAHINKQTINLQEQQQQQTSISVGRIYALDSSSPNTAVSTVSENAHTQVLGAGSIHCSCSHFLISSVILSSGFDCQPNILFNNKECRGNGDGEGVGVGVVVRV